MSTRSGKRIHASFNENPEVDTEVLLRSERKTRSMKKKEDFVMSTKKKKNFVSYPADEDPSSSKVVDEKEKRKTRRNTLKEQNNHVLISNDTEPVSIRKTRKGKKIFENDSPADVENIENTQESETKSIRKDKKKGGKKKSSKKISVGDVETVESQVVLKKGTKKKKKSNSHVLVEEKAQESNMSVDSFHSAAGSPVNTGPLTNNHDKADGPTTNAANLSIKEDGKGDYGKLNATFEIDAAGDPHNDDKTLEDTNPSLNETITLNAVEESTKKRKKSSIKNSTFDKNESVFKINETKGDATFDKSDTGIQNSTFDKNEGYVENVKTVPLVISTVKDDIPNNSVNKTVDTSISLNAVEESTKKRKKSSFKNSTFDKSESVFKIETKGDATFDKSDTGIQNSTFDKNEVYAENVTTIPLVISTVKNDIPNNSVNKTVDTSISLNTVEKVTRKRKKSSINNSTYEKTEMFLETKANATPDNETVDQINKNSTFDKSKDSLDVEFFPPIISTVKSNDLNSFTTNTVEKSTRKRKNSSIKHAIFDKTDNIFKSNDSTANTTFEKDDTGLKNSTFDKESPKIKKSIQNEVSSEAVMSFNGTFDKSPTGRSTKTESPDTTSDKDNNVQLNTTFDKTNDTDSKISSDSSKSSLISSDATVNVTDDKSVDNSHISITSDESKTENISNVTAVLIESSIDESMVSKDNTETPEASKPPSTPLRREGTFTKDETQELKHNDSTERTPERRKSLPSAGTPFPFSRNSQKETSVLNVTRSIEKSVRRSSVANVGPKQTRVMFCSPVNSPAVVSQMKGKVIKSSLKGSNKTFVFDNSPSVSRPVDRKRSHTHNEAETSAKRSRFADYPQSGDKLPRSRTQSAAAKLPDRGTPFKKAASQPKAESKVHRTKLPNFAALHQKQFSKMESLDECQMRKAKRARLLLTPTGSMGVVDRISPKDPTPTQQPKESSNQSTDRTPSKPKLPTLASLNPGFTRFGFRLNTTDNPFSVTTTKKDPEAKEKSDVLSKRMTLPSRAGSTLTRRDVAKQIVMREKTATDKRDVARKENRTVIKGVRTNRRFDLQMKLRNINA